MTEWDQPPGGSTPTLEDALEKIRQQLKRFKGGPLLILVAVVVVIVLWTAWFTVQPEETGIVQRFGKVMRTAGPGLHFKLPYGIEKVRLLPTARVLKEEFGFRTVSAVPGEKTRYDTRRRLYLETMTGFLSDMKGLYIVDQDQKAMASN
jgi:membrane protease subunit HflK